MEERGATARIASGVVAVEAEGMEERALRVAPAAKEATAEPSL